MCTGSCNLFAMNVSCNNAGEQEVVIVLNVFGAHVSQDMLNGGELQYRVCR